MEAFTQGDTAPAGWDVGQSAAGFRPPLIFFTRAAVSVSYCHEMHVTDHTKPLCLKSNLMFL